MDEVGEADEGASFFTVGQQCPCEETHVLFRQIQWVKLVITIYGVTTYLDVADIRTVDQEC